MPGEAMTLSGFLSYDGPLLMERGAFESLRASGTEAIGRVDLSKDGPQSYLDDTQRSGPPVMTVSGGVATIRIHGPLMRFPGFFMRLFYGATCLEEIRVAANAAAANESISRVILDVDSPGGTVQGTEEAAEAIFALSKIKNVHAHTSGVMASAAYWLASQANTITATPSSTVGSIGVLWAFRDLSEAYKNFGVKTELFTSGKFKAAGFPGTSLTKDQRELIQGRVDSMFTDFRSAVLRQGRSIKDDSMQGQTFYGRRAEDAGLCEVVGSVEEVTSGSYHKSRSSAESTPDGVDTNHEADMPKENETEASELNAADEKARADKAEAALKEAKVNLANAEAEAADEKARADKAEADMKAAQDLADEATKDRDKAIAEKEEAEKAVEDFDGKVAARAAEIAGNADGEPVGDTTDNREGEGEASNETHDEKVARLWNECDAIEDPAKQRAFYEANIRPLNG